MSSVSLVTFDMDHRVWKSALVAFPRSSLLRGRGRNVPLPVGCPAAVVSAVICREPGGSLLEKICAAPLSTRTAMLWVWVFFSAELKCGQCSQLVFKTAPAEQPTVRNTQQQTCLDLIDQSL